MNLQSKHFKKRWIIGLGLAGIFILAFLLWFTLGHLQTKQRHQLPSVTDKPVALNTDAKAGLVVDMTTGQVLGEKNADQSLPIASLSKLLTAYAVLKNIEARKIKWTDQVTIPASADLSDQQQDVFSHLDIKTGDRVSVKDLYTAMFTNSANDAAFALADHITPKGETTQQMLQYWAKNLKLTNSKWYNAAGQQNGDAFANRVKNAASTAANSASARDIAVIARADLNLDPSLNGIGQQMTLTYTKNGNDQITVPTDFGQSGIDHQSQLNNPHHFVIQGLKTGSTPESGAAFAGIITDDDGHQFLTVINGAGDYEDRIQRYQKTFDMLDQVLSSKESHRYEQGTTLPGHPTLTSKYSQTKKIAVHIAKGRTFWTDKGVTLNWQSPSSVTTRQAIKVNQVVSQAAPALRAQYLPATPINHREIELASDKAYRPAQLMTRILRFFGQ